MPSAIHFHSLKARDPTRTAQQVFDHRRGNAERLGYLKLILRQSGKDRSFTVAADFGKPLWINNHGAPYGNQIGADFDGPLGIPAGFNPAACHDRTAASYDAGKFRDR